MLGPRFFRVLWFKNYLNNRVALLRNSFTCVNHAFPAYLDLEVILIMPRLVLHVYVTSLYVCTSRHPPTHALAV